MRQGGAIDGVMEIEGNFGLVFSNQLGKIQQDGMPGGAETPQVDLSWYPKQKLSILRQKLRGINPALVLLEELKSTKHSSVPYAKNLEAIVRGDESRIRRKMKQANLPIADQVDCLIDMANDPNILGRSWTGWGPYA